jgi:hypothetical protein
VARTRPRRWGLAELLLAVIVATAQQEQQQAEDAPRDDRTEGVQAGTEAGVVSGDSQITITGIS